MMQYSIPRSSLFERSGKLTDFRLEKDVGTNYVGKKMRFFTGCADYTVPDGNLCTGNVGEGYGEGGFIEILFLEGGFGVAVFVAGGGEEAACVRSGS